MFRIHNFGPNYKSWMDLKITPKTKKLKNLHLYITMAIPETIPQKFASDYVPIIIVGHDEKSHKTPEIVKLLEKYPRRSFFIDQESKADLTAHDQEIANFRHQPVVIIMSMEEKIIEMISNLYPRADMVADDTAEKSFLQKRNDVYKISRLYYTNVSRFVDCVLQDQLDDLRIRRVAVDADCVNRSDNVFTIEF